MVALRPGTARNLLPSTILLAPLPPSTDARTRTNNSRSAEHILMEYSFCPKCGGALESRLLKTSEPARLVCKQCEFVFFLDPKVAACTVIHEPGGIVLLQRAIEPGYGRWVFPGGYVDRGELLTAAAIREAREECGLEVRLDGLVNIYSYAGRTPVIIVYAATAIGGDLSVDDESSETAEFALTAIPWDELAFASTADGLRDYMAGLLHPVAR